MATALKSERRVIYLYGITETRPRKLPELLGVGHSSTVEVIECEGIFCWTSRVSSFDFEKNLASNIEDLEWLAETSVAHQRVIAAIAQDAEVLPARLGTIFRSQASLCRHVEGRASGLKQDFARIRGADEWGVKVFAIEPIIEQLPKLNSGKDYLRAKAALIPKRRSKSAADGEIVKFERALSAIATEKAPAGNVSRGQRGLSFQTTLLIKRSHRKKLESLLEKFARLWEEKRRIECTGPWPPYSFVSRPDDGIRQ